jgi:uncharacterized protein involved in type VI secretion and phage assembly
MALKSLPKEEITPTVFPGLYVGKVEDFEEEAELGRIKVSIPSVFGQSFSEYQVWARPCFPYGHFYMPEEGDKVWVAFENGNPRNPVWLGIVYPEGTVPEAAQASPPKKRVIQSSSGHLIVLNDTEGEESITLQFKSDDSKGKITLDNTALILSFGQSTLTLNDQGITLDAPRIDLNP